ncbi:MAG TPA: macro domain-containing protein [Candidatus Limnocylindrales bacterium]
MTGLPMLQIARSDGRVARLALIRGDITRFPADAIVNAANSSLAGGAGVDGAIHNAAGPELMVELRARYRGCPTGSAVITGAGRLSERGVRHVIHAVGPIWQGGGRGEAEQLASAYHAALALARDVGAVSVAIPAISCGVYGYPLDAAAKIAIDAVARDLTMPGPVELATFVLFSEVAATAFARALIMGPDRVGEMAEVPDRG